MIKLLLFYIYVILLVTLFLGFLTNMEFAFVALWSSLKLTFILVIMASFVIIPYYYLFIRKLKN